MKCIVIATVLANVVLLTSCGQNEEQAVATPRPVEVVVARERFSERVATMTGEVRARIQTELSFRVSGKIAERLVDVGATVKAGQLLARLDPEEQKADMEIAVANLHSAEAQQVQAQQAFDRQKKLFDAAVTARSGLDEAQEALLTAQGSTRSARANLDTAKDALSYTELRADADGIITARSAEAGQVAQAAQAVFTIAHDGPRDAVFDVYESLFLGKRLEEYVGVSLLADPSRKINARIREISPTIDSSSGTIKVKVGLNGDASLPLGGAVAGYFRFAGKNVVSLPWSAMASKGGHSAVWVVDPASSAVSLRPIEIADYQTEQFIVATGISPGDLVVTAGTKFLRSGELVTYNKEQAN